MLHGVHALKFGVTIFYLCCIFQKCLSKQLMIELMPKLKYAPSWGSLNGWLLGTYKFQHWISLSSIVKLLHCFGSGFCYNSNKKF